ncbi:MAG TPA: hypothetical protein VGK67_11285 [Myxococcales bacterium]|jgi:membrane protein implicated in regulation of membrane protease activity
MMGNVYLFCLVLGATFTIGGALLGGLLGGGHHGGDAGGHDLGAGGHDLDAGGHDLDASTSHEVSGGDYEADAAGDAGHGDGEVGREGSPMHLPLLSPTVISAFVASFGGAGLLFKQLLGDNPFLHVPLAGATAMAMAVAMAYLIWKITSSLDSNRMARITDAVGTLAEVTVSVPKQGMGEVAYVSANTRQTMSARSVDGNEYKQGSRVKVLRVNDGVAYVGELPAGTMAAVGEPLSESPSVGVGEPVRDDRDRSH